MAETQSSPPPHTNNEEAAPGYDLGSPVSATAPPAPFEDEKPALDTTGPSPPSLPSLPSLPELPKYNPPSGPTTPLPVPEKSPRRSNSGMSPTAVPTTNTTTTTTTASPPEKEVEKEVVGGGDKSFPAVIGKKTNGSAATSATGALQEFLDVSREEVQMTLSFFAIPWTAIVVSARILNWLVGLTFDWRFIDRPANILFTLAGPTLVFHLVMVVIVLAAGEVKSGF